MSGDLNSGGKQLKWKVKERNTEVTIPYLDYNQLNGYLLTPYIEELIPADHAARVVNSVVALPGIWELTSQEESRGSSSIPLQNDTKDPDLCL